MELTKDIDSLSNFKRKTPDFVARMKQTGEIRQLLYGKRSNKYRILFEVRDKTVIVLRVRHGARRILGEDEASC